MRACFSFEAQASGRRTGAFQSNGDDLMAEIQGLNRQLVLFGSTEPLYTYSSSAFINFNLQLKTSTLLLLLHPTNRSSPQNSYRLSYFIKLVLLYSFYISDNKQKKNHNFEKRFV